MGRLPGGSVLRRLVSAVAYLGLAVLLLRPILQTYVIADDFEAPLSQFESGATSFFRAASLGWQNSFVAGDRTRTVGAVIGDVANWLWFWVAKTFGLSVLDVFSLIRFVCLVACAVAMATLWWGTARHYFRSVRWSTALLLTSVTLFGTLQLHGSWSNDPVESYPLAGYASAAIGFGILSLAVWVTLRPTLTRYSAATVAGVLAVSYYEFNVGAVLGGAIILAAAAWPDRRRLRVFVARLAGASGFLLASVLWLLASGAQNSGSNYSGRAIQASGTLHELYIGIVSSLPGAAWSLSARELTGDTGILGAAVLTGVAVVAATAVWLRWWGRNPIALVAPTSRRSNLMLAAVAAAVGLYAVCAIGLEASTLKVQQEVLGLGYVYTAYAVGSAATALLLAVSAWLILTSRRRWGLPAKAVVATGVVGFIAIQGSYNGHLKSTLDNNTAENQSLDAVLIGHTPMDARCDALRAWISYPSPAYYRSAVVRGSEAEYQSFYGQLLCSNLVAPGAGFAPENPPPSHPQWWLEANDGTIDLRTSSCNKGCSGILYFRAGGLGIGHYVTLDTAAMRPVHVQVPNHWKRFAVPVRLTGTYTHIGITASGSGVTPASVHTGPGTIPLLVDFANLRFERT